jgi:hypothetical protein
MQERDANAPPRAGELSSAERETEGGVVAAEHNLPLPLASLGTSPARGGGRVVRTW